MEKIDWTIDGMTCSNCALSVRKYLEKEGMESVQVDPISGQVLFVNTPNTSLDQIRSGIEGLGYRVQSSSQEAPRAVAFLSTDKQRFLFTLPFTVLLLMHMIHHWVPVHFLMNGWVQLGICIPVFVTGIWFFGRSAWNSLRNGLPNMNVLITLGALVSFGYSLIGLLVFHDNTYYFFETTASIINLVFLGNYLEEATVSATQKALKTLIKRQRVTANMIAFDQDHQEQIFPVDNTVLKTGDLILIRTGEQVPADCKVLWGDGLVNESIITGESNPVWKHKKSFLIGGSVVEQGSFKAQVTTTGADSVLSGIIRMVQEAQAHKPPVQKLADQISAVFVPIVIGLSVLTFFINWYWLDVTSVQALMRSIAVLVISCPCAMGLATPAAIAVGMGRGARSGILFRNASVLERFKSIRQVVLDKTGTLTTGQFEITGFHTTIDAEQFKSIVASLEKHSTHPIARSVANAWSSAPAVAWKQVNEIRGKGMQGTATNGDVYTIGSALFSGIPADQEEHAIWVRCNQLVIGWLDVEDRIRPEAEKVIQQLKQMNITPVMLTGDRLSKAKWVADRLGIDVVHAEKSPEEKWKILDALCSKTPTAMVGDGINDAPALSRAQVGISLGQASQLAQQQADVILMSGGLEKLPESIALGRHTLLTIRRNLFWAFAYNLVAIPIAALGFLTPTLAALTMGFSDVMLAIISLHLFIKKLV